MAHTTTRCRAGAASAIAALLLAPLSLLLPGCASPGAAPAEEERPFVIGNAAQLKDLYWRGELTDQKGNRWNVWILPGIAPPFEDAGRAFRKSGDVADDLVEAAFWEDRALDFKDGCDFAWRRSLKEFTVDGTSKDIARANAAIAANAKETPFGWIPRIGANAFWGYRSEERRVGKECRL